jgi:hypothetical protein
MTKPRNKTLSKTDRETLFVFARTHVTCPTEQAAFAVQEKIARKVILAAVHAKYPPKHMAILKIYDAAQTDSCIQFGAYYDRDAQFDFTTKEEAPLAPRNGGCLQRTYDFTPEQKAILAEYQLAKQTLAKAIETKLENYRRLIIGSSSFNDVAEVWPAVETLRSKIIPQTSQQRALAVLSAEAIALIKADNAGAQVQA